MRHTSYSMATPEAFHLSARKLVNQENSILGMRKFPVTESLNNTISSSKNSIRNRRSILFTETDAILGTNKNKENKIKISPQKNASIYQSLYNSINEQILNHIKLKSNNK